MQIDFRLHTDDIDAIAERLAERLKFQPADQTSEHKLYWTEREAAEAVGVSHHSVKRWREQGYFRAATTKRPILYTREDIAKIAKWLASRSD